MIAWYIAVVINTPASYEAFLAQYQSSDFAPTAMRLLERARNRSLMAGAVPTQLASLNPVAPTCACTPAAPAKKGSRRASAAPPAAAGLLSSAARACRSGKTGYLRAAAAGRLSATAANISTTADLSAARKLPAGGNLSDKSSVDVEAPSLLLCRCRSLEQDRPYAVAFTQEGARAND